MSVYSRSNRLYILARALTDKHMTPDSSTYAGFIIGVSAANFYRDKDSALEDAETLTSAYKKDKWQCILTGTNTEAPSTLETDKEAPCTSDKVEAKTPTLNTLKTFNLTGPCTPVKKLTPKPKPAQETAPAEHEQSLCLLALARRDVWCGVGRVTLAQARDQLENKTLTIDDVQRFIQRELPGIEVEKRSGPSLAFFLEGKTVVQAKREAHKIVPDSPIVLMGKKEYYKEPPLEKADFKGKRVVY